jgi:hypothetical protein
MGFLDDLKRTTSNAVNEIIEAKKDQIVSDIQPTKVNSGDATKSQFEQQDESEPSMMPYLLGGLAVLALAFFVVPQNKGG